MKQEAELKRTKKKKTQGLRVQDQEIAVNFQNL